MGGNLHRGFESLPLRLGGLAMNGPALASRPGHHRRLSGNDRRRPAGAGATTRPSSWAGWHDDEAGQRGAGTLQHRQCTAVLTPVRAPEAGYEDDVVGPAGGLQRCRALEHRWGMDDDPIREVLGSLDLLPDAHV